MHKNIRKKVRLADIASEAGVSTVTVAKALNSTGGKNARVGVATAARIRKIATRLNYRPDSIAQQLAGKKSGVIGVVMDSCAPQVYHTCLSNMEMYASARGYKFMIGQTHNDIEKIKAYAYEFSSYGVEGIICMSHLYPEASDEISKLYDSIAKTVFFEKPVSLNKYHSVSVNTQGAYTKAVEYFVGKGKKKIALFLIKGFFAEKSQAIRESGYLEGLKNCNLAFDENLIQRIPTDNLMNEASYLPIIKKLAFEQKVDAILTCNDEMAAMIMKTLLKLKIKVPDDISIIGYDNTDVAKLISPSLTTFDQNNDEISKTMIDLLINLIKGEKKHAGKRNFIIEPTLIEREST